MKAHWADKFILRDLFWFLVLSHRFRCWLDEKRKHERSHHATR